MSDSSSSVASSAPASAAPPTSKKRPLPQWLKLWSSFRIAFWTMVLMAWATWLGTLYQDKHGLLAAQERFFESWAIFYPKDANLVYLFGEPALGHKVGLFASHTAVELDSYGEIAPTGYKYSWFALLLNDIQKLRTPFFPGGVLLMAVLSLNLIGGVVRIFWQWNLHKIGALTGHVGVLILMAAAAVSHIYKREGYLEVAQAQGNSVVRAFADPILEIREEDAQGKLSEESLQIKPATLRSLFDPRRERIENNTPQLIINDPALPFVVEVLAAAENVLPARAQGLGTQYALVGGVAVDGFALVADQPKMEGETNLAGVKLRVKPRNPDYETQSFLLFEASPAPALFEVEGRKFWINLDDQRWQLPFTVRLDRAKSTTHPGTELARSFESYVTRLDPDGGATSHHIEMNKPMRTGGYTLFQARMSQPDSMGMMTSTFEVVDNPSDKWPEIACWVIAAGLTAHFTLALAQGLARSRAKRA